MIARCTEIAKLLDMENPVPDTDVRVDDSVLAPGYGQMNDAVANAIKLAAAREAILVDPVYTGRVMAVAMAAAGKRPRSDRILVIHTGGSPALFAYEPEIAAILD